MSAPSKIRFFGIDTIQKDDLTVCMDADDKLNSPNEYSPTRIRLKQSDGLLNDLKEAVFCID